MPASPRTPDQATRVEDDEQNDDARECERTSAASPLALATEAMKSIRMDGTSANAEASSRSANDESARAFAQKKFHSPTDTALSPASKFVRSKAMRMRRAMGTLTNGTEAGASADVGRPPPAPRSRFGP